MRNLLLVNPVLACLFLFLCSGSALAEGKSADAVAKELANPAGSLASLSFNLQYLDYSGNLPKADDQNSTTLIFQPTLPFPIGDQGQKIIFRPAMSLAFDQPVFDPSKSDSWDSADVGLTDTTFDLVYAGTEMTSKHEGYLWGVGLAGTVPTATNTDLKGDQWRFGPEVFGGIIRKWGIVGALVSNQWDTGGSNDVAFSTTTSQYFYAYGLGNGWQLAASPVITYDWQAEDSDDALSLPLGFGVAKTTKIGDQP